MNAVNHYLPVILLVALCAGCARFESKPLSPADTAARLENRSLTNAALKTFLENNLHRGLTGWPHPQWDFDMLTLAAFYYQPDLAVARAQWAVAQAGQIIAGEHPNPSVSFTPTYDTTTPPPWIFTLSWDIPIETAGKRGYRIAQAQHLTEAARWKFVTSTWQVRGRVRSSFLDLYSATQTQLLLAQQESAQSNVVRLLEGQFRIGNISEFEVTQARIELDTTRLSLQEVQRQEVQARATLAEALGLSLRALDGVELSFTGLDEFPTSLTEPDVRRQAILNRSDVRSALAEYAASQSALQIEIAKQYPDVHLGPGYELDQTDNKWSLGATVTLPILNQNQGAIAEARAKRNQAAAQFQAVQAAAIGEIDRALAGYQSALQQSATASALVQNSQKRLDSVRAMQRAGELDPLAVVNAQVEYDTGALARLGALAKARQALGQLENAVQSPLPLLPAELDAATHQPESR